MTVTTTKRDSTKSERLIQKVVGVWEAHVGAPLPLPSDLSDTRQFKEFCVGLLENPDSHPWSGALSTAGARKRLSVAASLFLFRKALPVTADERMMCRNHRRAFVPACRESRQPLPRGYLDFVRRIIHQEMEGFYKGYNAACWSHCPSVSSCTSNSRSKGGVRALRLDRSQYLRRVLGKEFFTVDNTVRYSVIHTGGKARGVTVASEDLALLSPLHKVLYDHLSSRSWILRGEAKPSRFRAFVRRDGEVFVSGDYENASDNLRVEVAEVILDTLQSMSDRIPSTVWEAAKAFLHCRIQYPDIDHPMESEGQLMGNLLCFPLLCLQNYIAFRWVFPASVPVKINGDDIVFRARREDYERWADFVSSVGLVLSRGKTLVNEGYFSLNSTFFWARTANPPRLVPVTRVGCFGKAFEDFSALAGSYRSFTRGFRTEAKLVAEVVFLKHFRKFIKLSGRSVRRGLGIPASIPALKASGLWKRECWYFDSVEASFDVLPESPSKLKWGARPPGWKRVEENSCRVTGEVLFYSPLWMELPFAPPPPKTVVPRDRVDALQRAFWQELVSCTWRDSPTKGQLSSDYWAEVLGTGWERRWERWRRGVPEYRAPIRACIGPGRFFQGTLRPRVLLPFAKQKRVDPTRALEWVNRRPVKKIWYPVGEGRVEELVEAVSAADLVDWELEVGLLTFEPPPFYETPDHLL